VLFLKIHVSKILKVLNGTWVIEGMEEVHTRSLFIRSLIIIIVVWWKWGRTVVDFVLWYTIQKGVKKNVCVLFFYMKTGYVEKWRGWNVSGKYEARQIINMVVVMHIVLHICNGITIFWKTFGRGPTWWNYLLLL
jgi:hypothetical protein